MKRSALREVLSSLLGRGRRRADPAEPTPAAPPADPPPQAEAPVAPIVSSGVVVHDFDVSDQYPGAVRRSVPVIPLHLGGDRHEIVLNVFEAQDVAVTTIYLPIDLKTGPEAIDGQREAKRLQKAK